MVTSCLRTSATRRSRTDLAAVSTALRAAASHDSLLTPITSVTRYTLSALRLSSIGRGCWAVVFHRGEELHNYQRRHGLGYGGRLMGHLVVSRLAYAHPGGELLFSDVSFRVSE